MSKQPYRLGLDMGTHSIGWAVVDLNKEKNGKFFPVGVRALGSRIFSDGRNPKDGTSLAAGRRVARSARRRRDRYLARRRKLLNALMRSGLMPEDESERRQLAVLNPYEMRARAVRNESLPPFFLGRALYHLNQRRGFKSNRKTASKDEMTNIGPQIEGLRQALGLGMKTLGEYFWERCQKGEPVRARPLSKAQKENLSLEDCLYPERSMLEEEFRRIREAQLPHQKLTKEDWDDLFDIIFFQRDLKPVLPGRCTIEPEQFRAPMALPSYQKFTIAQNLRNLELVFVEQGRCKRKLNAGEWDILWSALQNQKTLKFDAIQKKLKLNDEGVMEYNLETERRRELKGNATACLLSKKEYFGKAWFELPDETQDEIVEQLLHIEDHDALVKKAREEWSVSEASAHHLANLTPEEFVPGYGRYCRPVLQKLVVAMRDQGLPFNEAAQEAGFHHSNFNVEADKDRLKYYGTWLTTAVVGNDPEKDPEKDPVGHFGRIPNPTVHIGLGQLMHVVNALIDRYGKPEQIVLEMARELKQTYEQKQEIRKLLKKNQDDNKRIDRELEKQGIRSNRDDRIKYKLWEELATDINDRKCPFSGKQISVSQLFSSEIEVEHLLPFAETLDDSVNNKTVCFAFANREKGKRSPAEAFAGPGSSYPYDEILLRAQNLPPRKRWRFDPDAMEKFRDEEAFLGRALNDTAYLSRLGKQYLQHICSHKETWVVPGRLTAFLRYQWGLDGILGKTGLKNRDDHRHHAIDALVVALTDRGYLQKVQRDNKGKIELEMPTPWGADSRAFKASLQPSVDEIIVSHRPDHSIDGQLHEETAYGKINPSAWEKGEGYNVVSRKAAAGLSEKEIGAVRSGDLRGELTAQLEGLGKKEFEEKLQQFASEQGLRHLRVLKKENPLIEIRHRQGEREHVKYLVPGQIHHVSFWRLPDGSVEAHGVSYYDANTKKPDALRPHPAAKKILKLHKGDMVKLHHENRDWVARVVSISPENKTIWLAEHFEGGNLAKRYSRKVFKYIFLSFSKIGEKQVRKVHVDPIGRVWDTGPVL